MEIAETEDREKLRKERAKKAVALALRSRWDEAVDVNRSILQDFSRDLEAYNRLGKALSELGRNREAKEAFQQSLEVSPNNGIAKKNLERLVRLGDETPRTGGQSSSGLQVFIEESGKAGVTSLIDLALPAVLLKLAPGHKVDLAFDGAGLKASESTGQYIGRVEPRLASRLTTLIRGGNRYEATVTSVGERELSVIVREVYRDPSQARTVSFPSRAAAGNRAYLPGAVLGYELNEEETEGSEGAVVKDWSDDDTEPGDDEAFTPVIHRIIHPEGEVVREEDEDS